MIKFKINDKTVEAPTSWPEVTVKHFIDPNFLSGSTIKLLAALTEIKPEELANCTDDLMKKFERVTAFMKKDPAGWKSDIPANFTLMNKTIPVPVNIEVKMFGQKIMMQEALTKVETVHEAIPDIIAIYFGAEIYPSDWFDKIEELKAEILPLPIREVASITGFFLTSFLPSLKSGKICWKQYQTPIQKVL